MEKINKRLRVVELFILLFTSFPYLQASDYSLNLPSRDAMKIVGVIKTEGGGSIGSGFLYARNWIYVVTAKHVIIPPGSSDLQFTKIYFICHVIGDEEDVPVRYRIDLSTSNINKTIFISNRNVIALRIGRFIGVKWEKVDNAYEMPAELKNTLSNRKISPADFDNCRLMKDVEVTSDVIIFGFPDLPPLFHPISS